MKRIITLTFSFLLISCASTQNTPEAPTSYIIDRKLITVYNPMQDGEFANFSEWGREYSRMHSELGRCERANVLTGRFLERVKISSMVLGKDKYNDVMWGIRDQAKQLAVNVQKLPSDLLNEYYSPLDQNVCKQLEHTANQIIFDSLDFGMRWREVINDPVKLDVWPVYQVFANELGVVTYNSKGYVERNRNLEIVLYNQNISTLDVE
jgi:hypothetical protein